MRAFNFKNVKYFKLEELCDAFAEDFDEAMQAVSSKDFISYAKQFGKNYKKLADILYRTRHLQNAVTLIIYNFTKNHRFVIFGKEYKTLEEIRSCINANGFTLFASENGFSKTIIPTIQNQKEKMDWITFENVYMDPFAIRFIKEYAEYDASLFESKVLRPLISNTTSPFMNAYELFSQDEVHLILAHRFSLEEVLKIRNWPCPVFSSITLLQSFLTLEQIKNILNDAFYLWTVDHIDSYEFYGRKAKNTKKQLIKAKKELKKAKHATVNYLCAKHRQLFVAYVKMADLYYNNKIKSNSKNENYDLSIPYHGVLVSRAYVEEKGIDLNNIDRDTERIEIPKEKHIYDINRMEKTIRKRRRFANSLIWLAVLLGLYLAVPYLLAQVETVELDLSFLALFTYQTELLTTYIYGGCLGVMLLVAIVYKIMARVDHKRFNKLCRLTFYKNNLSILKNKELEHYKKLEAAEEKLAKKIDHGYRLIGCLGLVAISLIVSIIVYSLNLSLGYIVADKAYTEPYIYLIFVPAVFCLLTGMLRHKKTALSILLCLIFSVLLAAGSLYCVANFIA